MKNNTIVIDILKILETKTLKIEKKIIKSLLFVTEDSWDGKSVTMNGSAIARGRA